MTIEVKVDNAVILAAGYGSRFVPITYDTPKGLVKVFGEPMAERVIQQLLDAGIKDIILVVGYLKDQFEYLVDKYGVELVENTEYSVKNNISSLYPVRDRLRNTLILPYDIYMEDNQFTEYVPNVPHYWVENVEGPTTEWVLELDEDGLISRMSRSGSDDGGVVMMGPAFITEEFSKDLKVKIEEVQNDSNYDQCYWEDLLEMEGPKLRMGVKLVPYGTTQEFESLEELRAVDDYYMTNPVSETLKVIMQVFKCELPSIHNIRPLKAGMTNDSFLFDIGIHPNSYVFRSPGVGTDELIDRSKESEVYDLIRDLKLSDELVYIDPDRGYKITKYYDKSRVLNPESPEEVKVAMTLLKSFHNSGLKVDHEFDISERIQYYEKLCIEAGVVGKFYSNYTKYRSVLLDHLAKLKEFRPKVLAHIDPVYTNFLVVDEDLDNLVLLDWEYAGMADPLLDVAMYSVYAYLDYDQILEVLKAYQGDDSVALTPYDQLWILMVYTASAGLLWYLWTVYKESQGEDFGDYKDIQYGYARDYYQAIKDGGFNYEK